MAKTLSEIIGGIPMTTTAQTVTRGIPNYIPPSFFNVTRRVVGNVVKYKKVAGSRKLAREVQYGAPSVLATKTGVSAASASLIHSFEHVQYDYLMLQNLQDANGVVQAQAVDEIYRQNADFVEEFNSLRTASVVSLLANGKIWFDGDGQMLFSSSGAVNTIDFSVPANNQNQLNGIIAASWATATTDIQGQIQAIKRNSLETTGYELRHAFYGINIPSYLTTNNSINKYLSGNPSLQNKLYGGGEIGDGFQGLTWHPVYSSFGTDANGTVREFVGPDSVTFTPDPTPDWYEFVEGSMGVPRTVDVMTGPPNANTFDTVYGKFGYAVPTHDPIGIKQYSGDTFLPLCKVGGALYIADVTP